MQEENLKENIFPSVRQNLANAFEVFGKNFDLTRAKRDEMAKKDILIQSLSQFERQTKNEAKQQQHAATTNNIKGVVTFTACSICCTKHKRTQTHTYNHLATA